MLNIGVEFRSGHLDQQSCYRFEALTTCLDLHSYLEGQSHEGTLSAGRFHFSRNLSMMTCRKAPLYVYVVWKVLSSKFSSHSSPGCFQEAHLTFVRLEHS